MAKIDHKKNPSSWPRSEKKTDDAADADGVKQAISKAVNILGAKYCPAGEVGCDHVIEDFSKVKFCAKSWSGQGYQQSARWDVCPYPGCICLADDALERLWEKFSEATTAKNLPAHMVRDRFREIIGPALK